MIWVNLGAALICFLYILFADPPRGPRFWWPLFLGLANMLVVLWRLAS